LFFVFSEKNVIHMASLLHSSMNLEEQPREGGVAWGEHRTRLGSGTSGRIHPRNPELPKQHPQEPQGDGNTEWAVKAEKFGPITPPDIQPPATPAPLLAPQRRLSTRHPESVSTPPPLAEFKSCGPPLVMLVRTTFQLSFSLHCQTSCKRSNSCSRRRRGHTS